MLAKSFDHHLNLSSVSHNSTVYGRASLSHRFAHTDEVLRNVSAIFAFKADSWNSIFGTKANFMEHLALLGYVEKRLLLPRFYHGSWSIEITF